jgi:hypothetical protein
MVYELIEKGKQDLPAILKYLADISTLQNIQSEPLHSIQINDIISLVEVTDEQRILVGALIALSNSNILISDNVKSILKLMQVDSGRTDLVRSIFKQQNTANANKRNRNIASWFAHFPGGNYESSAN